MDVVDSDPNLEILGAWWEYTLDETHFHIHAGCNVESQIHLSVSLWVEIGNAKATQTVTRTQH